MEHRIYRNLHSKDTIFGLELYDLVILAAMTNIVFRLNQSQIWSGKILNVVIVLISYLLLVVIKKKMPPDYIKNQVGFLFRTRRYLPDPEEKLNPLDGIKR